MQVESPVKTRLKSLITQLRDVERKEQTEPVWEIPSYAIEVRLRYSRVCSLARDKEIVDLCCGTGWGSYDLAKFAKTVIAIDRRPACIEYARLKHQRPNISFQEMDALNLILGSDICDLVVANEAIEHFSKEEASILLNGIKKILRPGGILFGTTLVVLRELTRRFEEINIWHKHVYYREELRDLLQKWFRNVKIGKVVAYSSGIDEYFICSDGSIPEVLESPICFQTSKRDRLYQTA